MMETMRRHLDLNQAMEFIGAEFISDPYIIYNPEIKHQYRVRAAIAHDGTMLFSVDVMKKAFKRLFFKESYYLPMGEPADDEDVIYHIGKIRNFGIYKPIKCVGGFISGIKECVSIPVSVEYIKKEKS